MEPPKQNLNDLAQVAAKQNGKESAYPVPVDENRGLTKRELFILTAAQAIISNPSLMNGNVTVAQVNDMAIIQADDLLARIAMTEMIVKP